MKRIVQQMHRYGEADFDRDYLKWGFHDQATQAAEAKSVLAMLPPGRRIVDLACGLGTHAIAFARAGHNVTGIDISETFIQKAKQAAGEAGVAVDFRVADIRTGLPPADVVTWIESSFWDAQLLKAIFECLSGGGLYITDVRNPEHPRTKSRSANWRTWREENGRFLLERHETDPAGLRQDAWIEVDPAAGLITEKIGSSQAISLDDKLAMVRQAGFDQVELRTMENSPFAGGQEPYWLWLVARRH